MEDNHAGKNDVLKVLAKSSPFDIKQSAVDGLQWYSRDYLLHHHEVGELVRDRQIAIESWERLRYHEP